MQKPFQILLTLPPAMSRHFAHMAGYIDPQWFAAHDPQGNKLGSGGGTANLLVQAWRARGQNMTLQEWLSASRKLVVHGGGDSRRLPAYAPIGKPFLPVPALRGSYGQRLDQTILDLQLPDYEYLLTRAPSRTTVMIASGDVLLRFGKNLPALPDVDVLAFVMQARPETAQHFGVFFVPREQPDRLAFFLQKPTATRIRELGAQDYSAWIDTGVWMLSTRAVEALLTLSGWDPSRQTWAAAAPHPYELYAQFGLALGSQPYAPDPLIGALTCGVSLLPESEFYHLGASRQMIETVGALQERDSRRGDVTIMRVYPDQVLQNAILPHPVSPEHHTIWIENSTLSDGWHLNHDHIITNVPDNDWRLDLPAGICLDFPPVGASAVCVRAYGIDDMFVGRLEDPGTYWLGLPASHWFTARGIDRELAGMSADIDIQLAPLFPMLEPEALNSAFLQWLIDDNPSVDAEMADRWVALPRLSARQITQQIDLERLFTQQKCLREHALHSLYRNRRTSIFYFLDLQAAAVQFAATASELPVATTDAAPMIRMHDHMWRAVVLRERNQADWIEQERAAFDCLREALLREVRNTPPDPQRQIFDDQIIWGRAPLRLDLAGGWTDTPPYCLQHGGQVVNLAVDLNGQSPIQVFAKLSREPEIVIRSIDLGVEQRITAYEQLENYAQPDNEFALAKAALALAGFLPSFHGTAGARNLRRQLQEFGGGIEISLLAAVPKGSGLGTSSILAATMLGALSELCGLGWNDQDLIRRTLVLEQMLTTGGGWQDQAGGITRSIKRIEAPAGLEQTLTFHWLPDHLFTAEAAGGPILLYYTGITRLAKQILQEIVRGMFLNASDRLSILKEIGANAAFAGSAIQRADYGLLCEAVRRSWQLNCRLDSGTNPPGVQRIIDSIADHIEAVKLLGAGGGGFLLMFAKDAQSADRIRHILTEHPPNERARFMRFSVSDTGLEITRS